MSSDRGDYRAIYTVLPDSPEFQGLSPHAQLVWFHLKLTLGPTGIDTMTAPEWQLAERSNLTVEQVREGLDELCEPSPTPSPSDGIPHPLPNAFLVRERNVFWLRNGLKFEPSRTLTNANHRTSVVKHITGLPKLRIVNDFAVYYDLEPPFPELWDTPSPSKGIPDHGNGDGERKRSTETETENGDNTPSPREASKNPDPLSEWLGEHAELVAGCPLVRDHEARKSLHAQFGPPEMRANAWKRPDGTTVPPEERPRILAAALLGDGTVVCAWGNHGELHGRGFAVAEWLTRRGLHLTCLGVNGTGHPVHPLYQPRIRVPRSYGDWDARLAGSGA